MKKLLTILMAVTAALFLAPIDAEAGGNSKKKAHKHSAHKHHHSKRPVRSYNHRSYNNRSCNTRSYHGHTTYRHYSAPRVYTYRNYGYARPVVPYFAPRISPGFSFHFGSRGYCR